MGLTVTGTALVRHIIDLYDAAIAVQSVRLLCLWAIPEAHGQSMDDRPTRHWLGRLVQRWPRWLGCSACSLAALSRWRSQGGSCCSRTSWWHSTMTPSRCGSPTLWVLRARHRTSQHKIDRSRFKLGGRSLPAGAQRMASHLIDALVCDSGLSMIQLLGPVVTRAVSRRRSPVMHLTRRGAVQMTPAQSPATTLCGSDAGL
jgi:hypothetical protein